VQVCVNVGTAGMPSAEWLLGFHSLVVF